MACISFWYMSALALLGAMYAGAFIREAYFIALSVPSFISTSSLLSAFMGLKIR